MFGIRTRLKKIRAWMGQTRDVNFIGFDKYQTSGAYHWNELRTNRFYAQIVDLIAGHIQLTDTVLDLGCGDGAAVGALAARCKQIVGVDADYHGIQLAKEKLGELDAGNASVFQASLSKVSQCHLGGIRDFDVVYSLDVLEHLPDASELLDVAQRMCKRDGKVVIGTPIFVRQDLVSPYHVKEWSQKQLADLAEPFLREIKWDLADSLRRDGNVYPDSYCILYGIPNGNPSG